MISHVHVVAPTQNPQSAAEEHSCKRSVCLLSTRTSGVMTHAAVQTIQGNTGYWGLLLSFISVLKIIHEKVFCLCKVGRKNWAFLGGIIPWQILPRANLKTVFSHRVIHFSVATYLRSQQWVCHHLPLEVSVVLPFSRLQGGCGETGASHAQSTSRARGRCSLSGASQCREAFCIAHRRHVSGFLSILWYQSSSVCAGALRVLMAWCFSSSW